MKDYINGEARTKVAYLRDMDVLYKDLIDGDNVTKEERTAFKHANTWHKKAIAMMKERLPDAERQCYCDETENTRSDR